MIIDAMDLLYTNRFDGFCIVSSDSDFTALAIRLKEQGVTVYGFGRKQTPEAFRNACSQFIYVENLLSEPIKVVEKPVIDVLPIKEATSVSAVKSAETRQSTSMGTDQIQPIQLPIDTIRKVFEQFDSEWIEIGTFAAAWKRLQVDVDPRTYGCKKFTDLVKKFPDIFEHEMRKNTEGTHEHMYAKLKI